MRQQAHITVSGIVRYVGFRYMILPEAGRHNIMGHVRNLDDRTVEIVCEGEREQIDGFIEAIKGSAEPVRVRDVKVRYADGTGRFKSFRIIPSKPVEEIVEGFSTWTIYLSRMASKQI